MKQLYPGSYDDLTDAEIGRAMKRKYPEEFGDYEDVPATPIEDARERIRETIKDRGSELAKRYEIYGAQALPNALRDPKFREEAQEIQLEALRRMDPEFAALSPEAQQHALKDEDFRPTSQGR